MNAIQDREVKTAGGGARLADASVTSCAQRAQRENTRAALIKKYETMLNMAELIVTFQLSSLRKHGQEKTMGELQYLIDQTRKGLHVSRPASTVSAE